MPSQISDCSSQTSTLHSDKPISVAVGYQLTSLLLLCLLSKTSSCVYLLWRNFEFLVQEELVKENEQLRRKTDRMQRSIDDVVKENTTVFKDIMVHQKRVRDSRNNVKVHLSQLSKANSFLAAAIARTKPDQVSHICSTSKIVPKHVSSTFVLGVL